MRVDNRKILIRRLARRSDAIRARLERSRAAVAGPIQHRDREAAMYCEDRVDTPVAQDCVHKLVRILAISAMLAEGQLISKVAVENVGYVVIAKSVILIDVIGVLLEGHIGAGLAAGGVAIAAVITLVVGQTF